ncbi:MAG: MopE-related protein [Myxococcota bacterium]
MWFVGLSWAAPLSESVITLNGPAPQIGPYFGQSVAGVGDVNGDGYDDVVVGEPRRDADAGAAYLYLGSATGLDPGGAIDLVSTNPLAGAQFGFEVAGGDLNGDGHSDVVVAAPTEDLPPYLSSGAFYVFPGSPTGVGGGIRAIPEGTGTDHTEPQPQFGAELCVGDLDGDGFDDLVVAAPFADGDLVDNVGQLYVYYGSPSGIGGRISALAPEATVEGSNYGRDLACRDDIDGDAIPDVVVSAPYEGRGTVFVHASSWPDDALENVDTGTTAFALSTGDIDGDDVTELTVLWWGSAITWFDRYFDFDATGAVTVERAGLADAKKAVVVGDVDADGYDDVLVGDSEHDSPATNTGSAGVYWGGPFGVDASLNEALTRPLPEEEESFGNRVAAAGDVNGDGYADLLVTAANPSVVSRVYLYLGGCDDPDGDSVCGRDCAPDDPVTFPGSAELDDPLACTRDADADGYGDAVAGLGYTPGTDCDDGDPTVYPGADEVPGDGVDQDCDDADTCWLDADGDEVHGGGTIASADLDCLDPAEVPADGPAGDCDDSDADVFPGAPEPCDGVDSNCADGTDDEPTTTVYEDVDGDGFGDPDAPGQACGPGDGWVADATDCDDLDDDVFPGGVQLCDGRDGDCDGSTDGDGPADLWYADLDEDGAGDPATETFTACPPTGWVRAGDDCDDADPGRSPTTPELADDGVDQDCDGKDEGVHAGSCSCAGSPNGGAALALVSFGLGLLRRRRTG